MYFWGHFGAVPSNGLSPVYRRSHMSMNVCVCSYWCDLLIREILSGHGQCTPQPAVMKSLLTRRLDSTEAARHGTTREDVTRTIRLGKVNVNGAKALTS